MSTELAISIESKLEKLQYLNAMKESEDQASADKYDSTIIDFIKTRVKTIHPEHHNTGISMNNYSRNLVIFRGKVYIMDESPTPNSTNWNFKIPSGASIEMGLTACTIMFFCGLLLHLSFLSVISFAAFPFIRKYIRKRELNAIEKKYMHVPTKDEYMRIMQYIDTELDRQIKVIKNTYKIEEL